MYLWIALAIALYGFAEIFTKNLIGRSSNYTEESVACFAPVEGVILIVCAFAVVLISVSGEGKALPELARIAGLAVLLVGAVSEIVLGQRMLKKRPDLHI